MHHLRLIVSTGVALVSLAATAGAQSTLNSLEVQRLVDRADPESHAALHRHFVALSAQFTADAAKHRAMACGLVGNPNHPGTPAPGWHCLSAATENEAAIVRELARYHGARAEGLDAMLPAGASPYEGGKGAPAPTKDQVRALERQARTPADHRFLEEYFTNVAAAHLATLERHLRVAVTQIGNPAGSGLGSTECQLTIKRARAAADAAIASAERHHQLANLG